MLFYLFIIILFFFHPLNITIFYIAKRLSSCGVQMHIRRLVDW